MGQNFNYREINFLRKYQLDSIKPNYDSFTNKMVNWQTFFLKNYNINTPKLKFIETIKTPYETSLLGKFLYHLNLGDYYFFKYDNKNIQANEQYLKALEISKKNKQLTCEAIKKILDLNRFSYLDGNSTYQFYINLYEKNAYDKIEKLNKEFYKLSLSFQYGLNEKWNSSSEKKLLNYTKTSKISFLNSKVFQLIGTYYHQINNNDTAIKYELKSLKELKKIKYNYKSTFNKIVLISLVRYYLFSGNNVKSQYYLKQLKSVENNKLEKQYKKYSFFYQAYIDSINNNYKSAYLNLGQYLSLVELQNIKENSNIFKEIEAKYQTEKKEKENLQLKQDNLVSEQKRKQNAYLFYSTLSFLFLGGTIGFLSLKSSRRKRLLAEQQKQLEKQKNLTLLKEQEINTINAMVDGQEKERIRIAEDLHDNIGSVLATLKLHFENLKLNREKKHFNQDELYNKTEKLIDETYLKVRNIAHAKNAGVIANKGLLVAVKLMAEKISDANKISIHVIDFGLDKRLENKLEISIFRIVQELITNIIKHAEATEATINIALYDQNLNIIIEDNGKGFNYNKTNLKEGIGLSSIQTRIKHLNGTFGVDSTINKGTSIIINIPIV